MTYLLYAVWILTLVLVVGELDNLVARRVIKRLGLSFPDAHWFTSGFLSLILPGLGQFLNGQPLKAFFLFAWPFATVWHWPIPRPWQLLALKTGTMLLPWWLIAVGDALVVGALATYRQNQALKGPGLDGKPAQTVDYYAYLAGRDKRNNSGK